MYAIELLPSCWQFTHCCWQAAQPALLLLLLHPLHAPAAIMWPLACRPLAAGSRAALRTYTASAVAPSTQMGEMLAKAERLFPGASNGNTIYQDTVISHGKGSRIFDSDGREYVDYVMGGGPMFLGHAHEKVIAAVNERMPSGTSFFAMTEAIIEHAEELTKHFPCAEQVRYCSSGTEATLFAIRAAKAKSGKPKILKFEGACERSIVPASLVLSCYPLIY